MTKKATSIPVNTMTDELDAGITIEKITFPRLPSLGDGISIQADRQVHRHNTHTFHLLQQGTVQLDIDFEHYTMQPLSVIYIHPDQVHRTTALDQITVISLAITNENLNPEYLNLLEEIVPVKPLAIAPGSQTLLAHTISLCLIVSERRENRLRHFLLKDACNTLVALILSAYLEQTNSTGRLSRFDLVTKAFREQLDRYYITIKRPTDYARKLNLSTAYLNECVKHTTGLSVSAHIRYRIILEAKRLLYHSNRSVKEIAAQLGYDDYPYFSRLFAKATGMTALAFRRKNRD